MFNNHFNKIYKSYNQNIILHKNLYNQIGKLINTFTTNKVLLDIGNGGQTPYDKSKVKKLIIYDISKDMLNEIKDDNIIKVEGDARNLNKIEDASIDIILFLSTLHHINGKSKNKALKSLNESINQANVKLKDNGNLIIVEPVLNNFFYMLESLFYKITFLILSFYKKDMVFIFSRKILIECLNSVFGHKKIEIVKLTMTGLIDPLLGTFPGIIKLPGFLMPTRMYFFQITKKTN